LDFDIRISKLGIILAPTLHRHAWREQILVLGIKMEFADGKVSISANNPDLGEAVEEIEAEY